MSFTFIKKTLNLLPAFLPFICLAGIVILQAQEYKQSVQKLNRVNYLSQEQEQAKLIEFQKETPLLGFDNMAADWSYLNFVQYFGDRHARETIGYKLVPNYFETISQLDPRFTQAYLRLSIANSMYAGYPEQTITLMEQVLASVEPDSEQAALLWTSKGLDELLFLGDKEAAIKSYKIAAKWAALEPSIPDSLTIKDLETSLKSTDEIDLKEAQIRAWSSVLVYIKDNQRSQEIVAKINRLQAEVLTLEQKAKLPAQSITPPAKE
ncbi:hypothetical protein [Pleurocapsa sp. FMAR1]|uniref:hypothetical protein n=1 Tax=Pleurocapsa sp. FMAR1 TaxID=3040204 RepID=UPI0029C7754B|nr:hypothetical protein [Pleurocapsa sp. FMAR1]